MSMVLKAIEYLSSKGPLIAVVVCIVKEYDIETLLSEFCNSNF